MILMTKKVLKSWYSLLNTESLEFEWGRDDESLDWYDKDCGLHIVVNGEKFYKSAFDEFEKSTQDVVEKYAKVPEFCYEEYDEVFPTWSQSIETKDDALNAIRDLAVDYDNCGTIHSLENLIDEMYEIATIGRWRN